MSSAPLTILNRDYLAIVHEKAADVSKSVQHCAAKLIYIFERLTLWKSEAYGLPLERTWFWIPIIKTMPVPSEVEANQLELVESGPRSLYEELQGEHCKDVIRAALKLISEKLGVIHRRKNPFNGQDRTFQYQANLERLAELKTLIQADSKKSPLESDKSSMEGDRPSLEGEISPIITKNNSPSSPSSFSKQNNAAVENVLGEEEETEPSDPSPTSPVEKPISKAHSCSQVQGVEGGTDSAPPAELLELKIEWNRTVQKAMQAHSDRIPNALAYVRQESEKRWVMNPTGLFIKALRNGYKPQKQKPVATQPVRVDLSQVEQACQMAHAQKEKSFIQAKLQWLVSVGMEAEAQGLCDRHPEWGFQLKGGSHATQP